MAVRIDQLQLLHGVSLLLLAVGQLVAGNQLHGQGPTHAGGIIFWRDD
jgi:hypothetical protein